MVAVGEREGIRDGTEARAEDGVLDGISDGERLGAVVRNEGGFDGEMDGLSTPKVDGLDAVGIVEGTVIGLRDGVGDLD